MSARATGVTLLLVVLGVAAGADRAVGQTIEITPFAGYETSGSYPLENPTTVQALRAEAATTRGLFIDYRVMQNVQAEFYWAANSTSYSRQSVETGQYGAPFQTRIDQYQLGVLYHLRDRDYAVRPYLVASAGFTHDSNDGAAPDRTAPGFGLGGGVKYEPSRHFGIRGDARWMPTYGSSAMTTTCDYYGNCYPDVTRDFLQRFNITIGLIVRP